MIIRMNSKNISSSTRACDQIFTWNFSYCCEIWYRKRWQCERHHFLYFISWTKFMYSFIDTVVKKLNSPKILNPWDQLSLLSNTLKFLTFSFIDRLDCGDVVVKTSKSLSIIVVRCHFLKLYELINYTIWL